MNAPCSCLRSSLTCGSLLGPCRPQKAIVRGGLFARRQRTGHTIFNCLHDRCALLPMHPIFVEVDRAKLEKLLPGGGGGGGLALRSGEGGRLERWAFAARPFNNGAENRGPGRQSFKNISLFELPLKKKVHKRVRCPLFHHKHVFASRWRHRHHRVRISEGPGYMGLAAGGRLRAGVADPRGGASPRFGYATPPPPFAGDPRECRGRVEASIVVE